MNIDTNTIVPISVANQNFSKVARLVDQYGSVVIMKNNSPRYIIYEFNQADAMQAAADDDVIVSSMNLMQRSMRNWQNESSEQAANSDAAFLAGCPVWRYGWVAG